MKLIVPEMSVGLVDLLSDCYVLNEGSAQWRGEFTLPVCVEDFSP